MAIVHIGIDLATMAEDCGAGQRGVFVSSSRFGGAHRYIAGRPCVQ
jgi:hypothetical protein